MRRFSFLMLSGLLVALAPAVPAAAGEPCGPAFGQHLQCWSRSIASGTVHVTLDKPLPFDGGAESHKGSESVLVGQRDRLVVEVPPRARTGTGGTVLLVLADPKARLVARDATIDPLPKAAVDELAARQACYPKRQNDPCALLGQGPMSGARFMDLGLAVDLSRHAYGVEGTLGEPSPTSATTAGKQQDQVNGNSGGTGQDPARSTGQSGDSGWDTATLVLTVLCAVLVILLGLLLLLIRRSARSVAVGGLSRRSLAAPGVGAVPAASTPRPRGRPRTHAPDEATTRTRVSDEATTRTRVSDETAARPRTQVPDEATTRLRTAPAARSHGRRVGGVPGPARPAVVRTELHPQGYVEVDHVLHRAVWAEPGRPPPAPGGLVDVTEAGERDSDVLYAFPPAPGRHAKAARP
ncbi:hypothetical protein ACFV06_34735 [Streptomyces sp. NPDC059618]|uniref:hypothetical protein n=1 Tax=Streptomyces sp. NPDC059618 TaxID=3346887 RepID=UPI0036B8056F